MRKRKLVNLFSFWLLISFLSIDLIKCDIIWIGNFGTSCDFVNNDLSNARTSSEDCLQKCNQSNGCTHFTWTIWNGGTCWMKKGIVYKDDAFLTIDSSIICGVMKNDNYIEVVDNMTIAITKTIVQSRGQLTSLPCFIDFVALLFDFLTIFLFYH
jgi:hypothetical protein